MHIVTTEACTIIAQHYLSGLVDQIVQSTEKGKKKEKVASDQNSLWST